MVVCLGSQPLPWPCFWIMSTGVGECLRGSCTAAAEQPWPHQQKQLMERSQLWHIAVPKHDRVSSAEQFARAGLARPQLLVWVPGKMMQKGREEGKVPFEKWQGQQESSEGEAY